MWLVRIARCGIVVPPVFVLVLAQRLVRRHLNNTELHRILADRNATRELAHLLAVQSLGPNLQRIFPRPDMRDLYRPATIRNRIVRRIERNDDPVDLRLESVTSIAD